MNYPTGDPFYQNELKEELEAAGMAIRNNQTHCPLRELDESGKDLDEKLLADANRELLREPIPLPKLDYLFV